jgi:hypothetical protein
MPQLAIVAALRNRPDTRRLAGQLDQQALCLSLFTLAVTAGNQGFWQRGIGFDLIAMN